MYIRNRRAAPGNYTGCIPSAVSCVDLHSPFMGGMPFRRPALFSAPSGISRSEKLRGSASRPSRRSPFSRPILSIRSSRNSRPIRCSRCSRSCRPSQPSCFVGRDQVLSNALMFIARSGFTDRDHVLPKALMF